MSRTRLHRGQALFVAVTWLAAGASACLGPTGPRLPMYPGPNRRPDSELAVIGSNDFTIHSVDRRPAQPAGYHFFEVLPGGHTVDVSGSSMRIMPLPYGARTTTYRSGLLSVCVKARAGRIYLIKGRLEAKQLRAYVIDRETGEPPKTPCGPDEDED